METYKKLAEIQKKLKAPKGQFNSFGKYKYRSCEDILEAVKPLLGECTLIVSDEIVNIGTRFYVKAVAFFSDGTNHITSTAFAREPEVKKGMDESQITGSSSSYARKYALNGLFCIDDAKDADSEKPAECEDDFISEDQAITVEEWVTSTSSDLAKFLKYLGVSKVSEIKKSQYQKAISALKAKAKVAK